MHNLISRNELASWTWEERETVTEKYDQVSDYFQCISECGIIDIITYSKMGLTR